MANNRMYIRCRGCGEELYLGKHFGDCWYYSGYNSGITLEEKLNDFYEKHAYCGGYPLECFEIKYEYDQMPDHPYL